MYEILHVLDEGSWFQKLTALCRESRSRSLPEGLAGQLGPVAPEQVQKDDVLGPDSGASYHTLPGRLLRSPVTA